MAEFESRGIAWNNLNFESIKLLDGHVMIDKFEFDFNSKPDGKLSIKNFQKFSMIIVLISAVISEIWGKYLKSRFLR